MARIRTIKPEFWTDEKVVECSPNARLLFIGILNFADDNGNVERSGRQHKMRIFPADDIDVEPLVGELIDSGLIREYEAEGGKYLHIKGFAKHQKIEKPSKPRHPLPEESVSPPGVVGEPSEKMSLEVEVEVEKEGIKDQGRDQGEKPSRSSPVADDRRATSAKRRTTISSPEASRLSEVFAGRILSNIPDFRELKSEKRDKTLQAWANEIGRMIRIDGRDPPEIERVIQWCQDDAFWRSNILSAGKLRQQFDRLKAQMRERGRNDGRRHEKDDGSGVGDVQKPGKYAHLGIRVNVGAAPGPAAGASPADGSSEAIPRRKAG